MATTTKIEQDRATITLSPAVGKILEKGGEAVIDVGNFTIRIVPKLTLNKKELRQRDRNDAQIWQKIERTYRMTRSALTRQRYPYLYGGR